MNMYELQLADILLEKGLDGNKGERRRRRRPRHEWWEGHVGGYCLMTAKGA